VPGYDRTVPPGLGAKALRGKGMFETICPIVARHEVPGSMQRGSPVPEGRLKSLSVPCPVPEIRGILPEASWLFFKARSEPDWR
jgi:hypothetical protein